jgi:hypothetical protein
LYNLTYHFMQFLLTQVDINTMQTDVNLRDKLYRRLCNVCVDVNQDQQRFPDLNVGLDILNRYERSGRYYGHRQYGQYPFQPDANYSEDIEVRDTPSYVNRPDKHYLPAEQ